MISWFSSNDSRPPLGIGCHWFPQHPGAPGCGWMGVDEEDGEDSITIIIIMVIIVYHSIS